MKVVVKTDTFDKWLRKLKDIRAKAKVLFRIQKLEKDGHYGDSKSVGSGIIEMRIHYGKGYRLYVKEKENSIIILLVGGDKSTQEKDIAKAKTIWKSIKKK